MFNNDPKDWVLHASFSDETRSFVGPSSISVPARQYANYPLVCVLYLTSMFFLSLIHNP